MLCHLYLCPTWQLLRLGAVDKVILLAQSPSSFRICLGFAYKPNPNPSHSLPCACVTVCWCQMPIANNSVAGLS
jgi:hypothetical protein